MAGNVRRGKRGMGRNRVRVGERYCLQKDARKRRYMVGFLVFKSSALP